MYQNGCFGVCAGCSATVIGLLDADPVIDLASSLTRSTSQCYPSLARAVFGRIRALGGTTDG